MFELVHSGVDGLDVAFCCTVDAMTMQRLERARSQAERTQQPAPFEIGQMTALVAPHGHRGGYKYSISTGETGAKVWIKGTAKADHPNWDVFVSASSAGLLAHGYADTRARIEGLLDALNIESLEASMNRFDYAMDFKTSGFEPALKNFVAHARMQMRCVRGIMALEEIFQPAEILRGRKVETVMAGKMPGDQITIYDKRLDCETKGKAYWYDAWDLDANDDSYQVWRVEIRSGKVGLVRSRGIRSLEALEHRAPDLLDNITEKVSYRVPSMERNPMCWPLHPIWEAVRTNLPTSITDDPGKLAEPDILEQRLARQIEIYEQQILGNVAGYAGTLGISPNRLISDLPRRVSVLISEHLDDPANLWKTIETANRARSKLGVKPR